MPKRRAASRWLSPSTWQAWRTLPYSSTENIPRLPARSDRAQGRHQGGTVWHRRGRDTQPTVSEGHFLTAAYNVALHLLDVGGDVATNLLWISLTRCRRRNGAQGVGYDVRRLVTGTGSCS